MQRANRRRTLGCIRNGKIVDGTITASQDFIAEKLNQETRKTQHLLRTHSTIQPSFQHSLCYSFVIPLFQHPFCNSFANSTSNNPFSPILAVNSNSSETTTERKTFGNAKTQFPQATATISNWVSTFSSELFRCKAIAVVRLSDAIHTSLSLKQA